jgi:hypothetical protein
MAPVGLRRSHRAEFLTGAPAGIGNNFWHDLVKLAARVQARGARWPKSTARFFSIITNAWFILI